jgi:hypothetical protein
MEKPERARGVATLRARAPTREFSMPTIREYSTPADTSGGVDVLVHADYLSGKVVGQHRAAG